MKNILRKSTAVILAIMTSLMMFGNVYAQQVDSGEFANARAMTNVKTVMRDGSVKALGTTRGRVLATAEMELTDKGGGEVDIYVEVFCHESVSKLRMKVYLEKWVESSNKWSVVDTKEQIWTSEEYGDDLSMGILNYNVLGVSAGKYRLRGSFSARGIVSGISEAWTHSTDALQIGRATTP